VGHRSLPVGFFTGYAPGSSGPSLGKPFAIDKRAAAAALLSVIDGALTTRMLYGTSKEIPILSPAEAVLKSFQTARAHRTENRSRSTIEPGILPRASGLTWLWENIA
jgi:hypothetical protein